MTMKRELWKPPFRTFPSWPCPTCGIGTIALIDETLTVAETEPSKEAHGYDAWEPEWIDERFVAMLVCNNANCKDNVAVCGRTSHVADHDFELREQNWARLFEPTSFNEAPPVFPIPENCPCEIKQELKRAFALVWLDIGSSANRLRSAIEAFLNERKIPKTTKNKNGKRVRLDLHCRIIRFRTKNVEAAKSLEAVKWLGNVGSHANLDSLTIDDLLDGFDLFEHAIERVYVRRAEDLSKMAARINKQKGKRPKTELKKTFSQSKHLTRRAKDSRNLP